MTGSNIATRTSTLAILERNSKVQRLLSPSINHPIHTYYTPQESPTRGLQIYVCFVYVAQVCATRAAKELPLTQRDKNAQSVSFSGNNENTRRPFHTQDNFRLAHTIHQRRALIKGYNSMSLFDFYGLDLADASRQ